jgi:hypothetical protein
MTQGDYHYEPDGNSEEESDLEGGYFDENGNWISFYGYWDSDGKWVSTSELPQAIMDIANSPEFNDMDKMGHVPHTPYRQERPNDPDTGPLRRR